MSTSVIALLIATAIVSILVIKLAVLSYLSGFLSWAFGKPKLNFYKSNHGTEGVHLGVNWNLFSEAIPVDYIRFKLFNPFGKPSQVDVSRKVPVQKGSFTQDVNLGDELKEMLSAQNLEQAKFELEIGSAKEGSAYQFVYSGNKFKKFLDEADEFKDSNLSETSSKSVAVPIPQRSFIADEVIGKQSYLKIATNPLFSDKFSPLAGETEGGATAEAQENYTLKKVWIEPGCIVCNACEDIFPEVFEVTSDTCLIRDGAPLDDGLRVEEASDACPVEVIKFEKAS